MSRLKDRDRTRQRRLVRLGVIRLGHKETKTKKGRDGKSYTISYPVQDDHFVLTDAPEIASVYGNEPQELDVLLPFAELDRNFVSSYTVWAGGVLVCKGDGDRVDYAGPHRVEEKNGAIRVYNDTGDTLVSDGTAQVAFDWNGEHFESGDHVPCSGASKDLYPHCAICKISSILKVMMADPRLFRMGYYQIATGSGRNYDTILGTLEALPGKVNGIPFKLRLVKEQTTYEEAGKRHKTEKWFLQLEPDPEITRELYSRHVSRMLGKVEEPVALIEGPTANDEAPWPNEEDPTWEAGLDYNEEDDFEEGEFEEEPEPMNGNGFDIESLDKRGFANYVIEQIPYFHQVRQVGDVMREIYGGSAFEENTKNAIFVGLNQYASKMADKAAA